MTKARFVMALRVLLMTAAPTIKDDEPKRAQSENSGDPAKTAFFLRFRFGRFFHFHRDRDRCGHIWLAGKLRGDRGLACGDGGDLTIGIDGRYRFV